MGSDAAGFVLFCFELRVKYSGSKVSSTTLIIGLLQYSSLRLWTWMPVSINVAAPLEVITPNYSLLLLNLGVSVSPETPSGAAHENTPSPI